MYLNERRFVKVSTAENDEFICVLLTANAFDASHLLLNVRFVGRNFKEHLTNKSICSTSKQYSVAVFGKYMLIELIMLCLNIKYKIKYAAYLNNLRTRKILLAS